MNMNPAELAKAMDKLLDQRDKSLLAKLAELAKGNSEIADVVGQLAKAAGMDFESLAKPEPEEVVLGKTSGHAKPWCCSGCSGLLGYYDVDTEEMRVRVGFQLVEVFSGPGGWMAVTCKRCSYRNKIDNEDVILPTNGEVVVFDVRTLEILLAAAQGTGSATVQLQRVPGPGPGVAPQG